MPCGIGSSCFRPAFTRGQLPTPHGDRPLRNQSFREDCDQSAQRSDSSQLSVSHKSEISVVRVLVVVQTKNPACGGVPCSKVYGPATSLHCVLTSMWRILELAFGFFG